MRKATALTQWDRDDLRHHRELEERAPWVGRVAAVPPC